MLISDELSFSLELSRSALTSFPDQGLTDDARALTSVRGGVRAGRLYALVTLTLTMTLSCYCLKYKTKPKPSFQCLLSVSASFVEKLSLESVEQ